jgi:hypothetical protein
MTKKSTKKPVYINNLWVEMTREELRKFLLDRATYFGNKAKLAEEQLKRVKSAVTEAEKVTADEEDDNPAHSGKGYSNTRLDNSAELKLQERLRECRDKEKSYRFMAEHLVANSIYRLSEGDMVHLGLMKQWY